MKGLIVSRSFAVRLFLVKNPEKARLFEEEIRAIKRTKIIRNRRIRNRLSDAEKKALLWRGYSMADDKPFKLRDFFLVVGPAAAISILRAMFGTSSLNRVIEIPDELFAVDCTEEFFEATLEKVRKRLPLEDLIRERIFVRSPWIWDSMDTRECLALVHKHWGNLRVPAVIKILEMFGEPEEPRRFLAGCRRKTLQ